MPPYDIRKRLHVGLNTGQLHARTYSRLLGWDNFCFRPACRMRKILPYVRKIRQILPCSVSIASRRNCRSSASQKSRRQKQDSCGKKMKVGQPTRRTQTSIPLESYQLSLNDMAGPLPLLNRLAIRCSVDQPESCRKKGLLS